jgi:hypothetical protein
MSRLRDILFGGRHQIAPHMNVTSLKSKIASALLGVAEKVL